MRAAFVKYHNNSDLPTLAEKLDHMFKTKLLPNAGKTKTKSSDEEVSSYLALVNTPLENLQAFRDYYGRIPPTENGF